MATPHFSFKWLVHTTCATLLNRYDFFCAISGERGNGKTQIKGSKVLMKDGYWKNVENIKIGDEVISPQKNGSSKFAKVIEVHNRFEKDIYEVREVTRNKKLLYTCAGNHDIPIYRISKPRIKGTDKRKFKQVLDCWEAQKISNHYTKGSHICSFSTTAVNYNQPNSSIEPYSLGVYLGDGSFSSLLNKKNQKSRGVCITTSYPKIIEEVSKHYPYLSCFNKKRTKAKKYSFSLNGELSKELERLGLEGKGSGEKFIPKECLLSSRGYRLKLLAGLIETDGYVNKQNSIIYTTKSNQLAEDVKNLVFSLGGYSSIRKIKKKCQNGFEGEYNNINISFENPKIIPLLDFKKERLGNKMKHNPRHIAIECVKGESQEVYGFEIDSDSKWYVTDNWMVTHNSTMAYLLARGVSQEFRRLFQFNPVTFNRYYNMVKKPKGISKKDFIKEIIHLKKQYNAYRFLPYRDLIYTQDETQKFLQRWKAIAVLDEMINITFSRDFYQEKQKEIIKQLNLNRDHNNLIIACVPKFYALDTQIRGLARMHIHIVKRGIAIVMTPNKLLTSKDAWDTALNEKIERKMLEKSTGKAMAYNKLTNFRGVVKFPALKPEVEIKYQKIKDDKRNVIATEEMNINSEDKKKDDPFEKLYNALINYKIRDNRVFEGMVVGYGFENLESTKRKIRERLKKEDKNIIGINSYYKDTVAKIEKVDKNKYKYTIAELKEMQKKEKDGSDSD